MGEMRDILELKRSKWSTIIINNNIEHQYNTTYSSSRARTRMKPACGVQYLSIERFTLFTDPGAISTTEINGYQDIQDT